MNLLKRAYIFLILFFIGYPILYLAQFWRMRTHVDAKDEAKLVSISQMLQHSSDQKPEDLFLNMFDVYRQTEDISFYLVRDQTGKIVYPSSENALAKEAVFKQNTQFQFKHKIRLQNQDYTVFFGKDEVFMGDLLLQVIKDQKEILLIFLLGIILLIHQVAAYFLNLDINQIIEWFKGRSRNGSPEILSKGGGRLKEYIQGVENQRSQAEQLVQEYKANSYSGLNWAHEQMKAGVTTAAVVAGRCDVNNYTLLKQTLSGELLQYIMQTFFNRGGEYLSRYGAYKENAAGDEITFFVPKNEKAHADLDALHIIRGFFEIFDDINTEIIQPNVIFTAKAALDEGTVELEKLGGNSETEGQPLINTARILSVIESKDACTLAIFNRAKEQYKDFIVVQSERLVKVKNYEEPFNLVNIRSIKGYSSSATDLKDLRFFKTDRDISRMLRDMSESIRAHNSDVFNKLRGHISTLSLGRVHSSVIEQYSQLLAIAMVRGEAKYLSGVTLLTKSLFPENFANEDIILQLAQCLKSEDKRVVSNTREALFKLKPQLINLREYVQSQDNRIAVDAMIDLVKIEGLIDEHSEMILDWLKSSNKNFQLSALYAAYKIYQYWIESRPEYIDLNPNFKKINHAVKNTDRSDVNFKKWIKLYESLLRA